MKRILFGILLLFTCLSAAFGLSGCTSSPASSSAPKGKTPIQIVCTNFAGYDFARQIAKGHADITLLIKPGTDVHSFEPTPKDIKKVENCDLFIYTGGDSDEWVDKIFSSSDQKPKAVCKMMDTVALLPEEHPEGMAEEKQDSSEKEDDIPVVFHIEMSNQQMSHSIAEATGAKDLLLNAVHNVSEEDFKKGITYVDLMKHNEDVLKEALNE